MTHTTPILGVFVIAKLRHDTAYLCKKYYDSSFIHSSRMTVDPKIKYRSCNNDNAPFRDDLLSIFTVCRNARIASAVLATAIPSICLSVCHTPVLCQNDCM